MTSYSPLIFSLLAPERGGLKALPPEVGEKMSVKIESTNKEVEVIIGSTMRDPEEVSATIEVRPRLTTSIVIADKVTKKIVTESRHFLFWEEVDPEGTSNPPYADVMKRAISETEEKHERKVKAFISTIESIAMMAGVKGYTVTYSADTEGDC